MNPTLPEQKWHEARMNLFRYIDTQFGSVPLESEMNDIEHLVQDIMAARTEHDVKTNPVNPRSPYECYWSRRALEAEKRLEAVQKLLLEGGSIMEETVKALKAIKSNLETPALTQHTVLQNIRKIMENI